VNNDQANIIELLIRKNALKDVELWLYQEYKKIDELILELENKNVAK